MHGSDIQQCHDIWSHTSVWKSCIETGWKRHKSSREWVFCLSSTALPTVPYSPLEVMKNSPFSTRGGSAEVAGLHGVALNLSDWKA